MTVPVLIACVGNVDIPGDDLGPRVARYFSAGVGGAEVVDLGTAPVRLLDLIDGRDAVIIVDAVIGFGGDEQRLVDIEWQAGAALHTACSQHSTHGLSILEQIELGRRLNMLPGVVRIIGWRVDPGACAVSVEDQAVEMVAERVVVCCEHISRSAEGPRRSATNGA